MVSARCCNGTEARRWALAAVLGASACAPAGVAGAADVPAMAAAAEAFATARFSTVAGAGGVPLNVVEAGDPSLPAILFIHGFRQSHLSWARQFGSDLGLRCHLVAFDLRGHGNSGVPWDAAAYDHSQPWADDVARVIQAKGLSRPLIVGWSYGGAVAMDFARHHPGIPVAGYLLVGTTAGLLEPRPAAPDSPPRPTTSSSLEVNIAAVQASTDQLFPPGVDAGLRDRFKAAAMRVSPFVDRAVARRAGESNLDLIAAISSPVTLVFGGRDPILGPAIAPRVAARWPAAKVETFAAGHAPFIDEPQRFNALLDAAQCRP